MISSYYETKSYLKYVILCKHDFKDSVFVQHEYTFEDIEEHVQIFGIFEVFTNMEYLYQLLKTFCWNSVCMNNFVIYACDAWGIGCWVIQQILLVINS